MSSKTECVLFDLDGTLVDTAPDIIAALNSVLQAEQQPPIEYNKARNYVTQGSAALVRLGFGEQQEKSAYRRRIQHFLEDYRANLTRLSGLFEGIQELLEALEAKDLRWGVVTNKPAWLTAPLMEELSLDHRASCIISGDSTIKRKPHPMPMLTAASIAEVQASNCLYLGDAQRDIEAGNAANMTTLVANWGYIDHSESPEQWEADGFLKHPLDCLEWLR